MKFSNIWKAWLSTLIGLLIPIFTGIATQVITGSIDWTAVKTSLIATAILAVTDLLKELTKGLEEPK